MYDKTDNPLSAMAIVLMAYLADVAVAKFYLLRLVMVGYKI